MRQTRLYALQFFRQFPALMIQGQNVFFLRLLLGAQVFLLFAEARDLAFQISQAFLCFVQFPLLC
jgi:hypothetical protein